MVLMHLCVNDKSVSLDESVHLHHFHHMAKDKPMTARKIVSLPEDLARQIEDFRFDNRISSEAEAIRRLIELGLSAAKGRKSGR